MPTLAVNYGWFLALLPPLVLLTLWVSRRSLAGLSPGRARLSLALRLALVTLFVAALAEPTVSLPSRGLTVLFLLDRSASIPAPEQARYLELASEAAARLPAPAEAGFLLFGRETTLAREPANPLPVPQGWQPVPTEATHIEQALRLGLALLPPGRQARLVLVSDGNETHGDAARAAEAAAADRVEIDVLPVAYSYPSEALLARLVAPERAAEGSTVPVRVVAHSTAPLEARLRLLRNRAVVAERPWSLEPGVNSLVLRQRLTEPGLHTWEALLEAAEDTLPQNNRALGFTHVRGETRVLLLEGRPAERGPLAAALRGEGLAVERGGPALMPGTLAELQNFDAVILDNVRADQLSPAQMRLLRDAARDLGLGVVMVGGEQSFASGGWRETPVEELLPVEMTVPHPRVEDRLALVLVIDRSGSMSGAPLEAARGAALATLDELRPEDELGVLAFDAANEWIVPLQRDWDPAAVRGRIGGIQAGGGTHLSPALVDAYEALRESDAAARHVLVLSDGESLPGDFDGIAQRMAAERITLTTVGLGPHIDEPLLVRLAQIGRGRYYRDREDGTALALIFGRDVQLARRRALVEEPFTPAAGAGATLLRGLPAAPPLRGYVAVTPREAAGVELPLLSHRGDPVVAAWRFGLGRTVAVTTDAHPRWAAPWLADGYFSQFWTRVVTAALRPADRGDLDARVELAGDRARVTVDALTPEGEFRNNLDLLARVATPGGGERLRLAQTGPGRYEGSFPVAAQGQYFVSVTEEGPEGEPGSLAVAGAALPYSPEFASLEADLPLLRSLAERTGGRVWPALGEALHPELLAELYRPAPPRPGVPQPVWPALVLAGALLLPFDIGVRRLIVSAAQLAAIAAALPILGALLARRPSAPQSPAGATANSQAAQAPGSPDHLRSSPEGATANSQAAQAPGTPPPSSPSPEGATDATRAPAPPGQEPETPTGRLLAAKQRARRRHARPPGGDDEADDARTDPA